MKNISFLISTLGAGNNEKLNYHFAGIALGTCGLKDK